MGVLPFIGLPKVLSQWERARTVLDYREAQDLFFISFALSSRDGQTMRRLVRAL